MEDWEKIENNTLPDGLEEALVIVFSSQKNYHLCCGTNIPQLFANLREQQTSPYPSLTHYRVLTLPPESD